MLNHSTKKNFIKACNHQHLLIVKKLKIGDWTNVNWVDESEGDERFAKKV